MVEPRTQPWDAGGNRDSLKRNGKLTIPALAVWGTISISGAVLEQMMMREVAEDVTALRIPDAAPEENPIAFAKAIIDLIRPANVGDVRITTAEKVLKNLYL